MVKEEKGGGGGKNKGWGVRGKEKETKQKEEEEEEEMIMFLNIFLNCIKCWRRYSFFHSVNMCQYNAPAWL